MNLVSTQWPMVFYQCTTGASRQFTGIFHFARRCGGKYVVNQFSRNISRSTLTYDRITSFYPAIGFNNKVAARCTK